MTEDEMVGYLRGTSIQPDGMWCVVCPWERGAWGRVASGDSELAFNTAWTPSLRSQKAASPEGSALSSSLLGPTGSGGDGSPPDPIQGDTPRQRAEKAQDTELAAYLENRQHYQMIQREDQETAV